MLVVCGYDARISAISETRRSSITGVIKFSGYLVPDRHPTRGAAARMRKSKGIYCNRNSTRNPYRICFKRNKKQTWRSFATHEDAERALDAYRREKVDAKRAKIETLASKRATNLARRRIKTSNAIDLFSGGELHWFIDEAQLDLVRIHHQIEMTWFTYRSDSAFE